MISDLTPNLIKHNLIYDRTSRELSHASQTNLQVLRQSRDRDERVSRMASDKHDHAMTDVATHTERNSPIERKRKQTKDAVLTSFTIRNPPWCYLHLSLVTPASLRAFQDHTANDTTTVDAITVHMHLQAAFKQFLGLHGSAIPFDILKIEKQDAWVRFPREDAGAVLAALGGWVGKDGEGWRVKSRSLWGPEEGDGRDLFD